MTVESGGPKLAAFVWLKLLMMMPGERDVHGKERDGIKAPNSYNVKENEM